MKTRIGKYEVTVLKPNCYSIVTFNGGAHGNKEYGDFAFWTAVYRRKKGGSTLVIGRARLSLDPGERFRRIGKERRVAKLADDRKEYRKQWEKMGGGKNIRHVRPSSAHEILAWMSSHKDDAAHVVALHVGGT